VDEPTSGKDHPSNTNFSLCRGEKCFYIKPKVQAAHPYIPEAAARTNHAPSIQDNILPNQTGGGRRRGCWVGSENLLKTYLKPTRNLLETVVLVGCGLHTISLLTNPISHHQLHLPHWNCHQNPICVTPNNSIKKSISKRVLANGQRGARRSNPPEAAEGREAAAGSGMRGRRSSPERDLQGRTLAIQNITKQAVQEDTLMKGYAFWPNRDTTAATFDRC